MALIIVHRLRDRLLTQTEIDADFSEFMFSFTDESDRDARRRMLEDYWGLKEVASRSSSADGQLEEDDIREGDVKMSTLPGEYDAESLLLDLIEEAVSFAVDKLFLHYEIYQFVTFFNQALEVIGEQLQDSKNLPTLSQALEKFEACLIPHYTNKITEHNFLEAVDYVKTTVFQHFHLYQFLLTQEQPIDLTTIHLPIEVLPSDPTPLAQGIEEEEWYRRERLGQLEQEHALREKELIESQEKAQAELQEKLKEAYQTELAKIEEGAGGKLLKAEEVAQVIDSLMSVHLDLLTSTVTHAMQRHALTLNARLENMETVLSTKCSNESLTPSPNKLGPPSPMVKKSRNPSRQSGSTATS